MIHVSSLDEEATSNSDVTQIIGDDAPSFHTCDAI